MKNIFWVFVVFAVTAGCSGVDWFPENAKTSDTPTAFSFASKAGVTPGETVTSDPVTISGIPGGTSTVKVSGDATSKYSINTGAFSNLSSSVKNNDQLKVQHTASSQPGTTVTTTVTIGTFSASFASTTALYTLHPTTFPAKTNVKLNELVVSEGITITGTTGRSFTIALNNPALRNDAFSVNGVDWFPSGIVQSGQIIKVRHTAAGTVNTPITTTVVIDGVAGPSFTSTTSATGL